MKYFALTLAALTIGLIVSAYILDMPETQQVESHEAGSF
jgi:hypothetical protein